MAFTKEIKSLESIIGELGEIKDMIYRAESRAAALERQVSAIDEALPDDEAIDAMKAGSRRDGVTRALELAKEAYDLVDEILGPPDGVSENELDGSAIMPQARGNDAISLEAALRKFNPGNPDGKNLVS